MKLLKLFKPIRKEPIEKSEINEENNNKQEVEKYIKNYFLKISSEKYFKTKGGQIIKDPFEIPEVLKNMDESIFRVHVNSEKNDFAEWTKYVFHEEKLADKIKQQKSKQGIIKVINSYKNNLIKEKQKIQYEKINNFKVIKKEQNNQDNSTYEKKYYNEKETYHLSRAFEHRFEKINDEVSELRKKGYDTKICELYLINLPSKINLFKHTSEERDFIKLVHIFYKLENEINLIKKNERNTS
jgi:hypothetical protein